MIEKIAITVDGFVIVKMSLIEWGHIEAEGFDVILRSMETNKQADQRLKRWKECSAYKIIKQFPNNKWGFYYKLYRMFDEKFDGSIEQLYKIARREEPFRSIPGLGKKGRQALLDALSAR